MATVLELQERLEHLRKARAGAASMVRTADGRTVEYKDDSQMAAAIADIERQITLASGVPIHTVLVAGSKGLDT